MRDFRAIANQTYDLIAIGGGINGAGVARDAAMRGLKTILIEKHDFSSGSSSQSTRLIHGGLRYLEYFEFDLVRSSLREREILLHIAPHLVKPLLLTIPIYRDRSRPKWKIQAGMLLYDILSRDKTLPAHRMLSKDKFQQLFRGIDAENLLGGAQYYDAQVVLAERLCLENIKAAQDSGATVLNYVEVTQLVLEGNRIVALMCKDSLTGEALTVRGSDRAIVVNTSGPWVDRVLQLGGNSPLAKVPKMGGTKGSHILVNPFPGAPETALYVEAKSDRRPFFIIPWLGMYLIGTTDIHFTGNLDQFKADNEEIDYLLAETNQIIPTACLSRASVKFTYSGVRPLPNQEGKQPGSITRRHILYDHASEGAVNLISLIGGKLTTYRHVAAEIVEAVYQKMGIPAPPCQTHTQPLPGAINLQDAPIQQVFQEYGTKIPIPVIADLFSVYGAQAIEVLALTEKQPELGEAIAPSQLPIKAQVVYAVQSEFAQTFVDIARHRTTLAMHGDYGLPLLPVLTDILKRYCGWSEEKCDRQTAQYHAYMQQHCIPDYA